MTQRTSLSRPSRTRRFSKKLRRGMAAVAALAITMTGVAGVTTTPPAVAATDAYGVGDLSGAVIGWQGSMRTADGTYVFCTDPGTDFPTGDDQRQGYRTSWKGVSGDLLAGINRALHEIDDKSDRDAAALNFVIKHVFDPDAMYGTHRYPNSAAWPKGDLGRYIEWVLSTTYPNAAGGWRGVRDRALELLKTAHSTRAGTGTASGGSGKLVFEIDSRDNYRGTVVMDGTAGSTGTITLTNGVFADTGKATRAGAKEGVTYAVRAVPPSDGKRYRVSGEFEFTPPGKGGYLAEVELWRNPAQRMIAKGRTADVSPFRGTGRDAGTRTAEFRPVLTSQAAEFASGQTLRDTLTFSVAADADGLRNPWATIDGRPVAVGFSVTAYGPYDAAQAQVDDVPDDAPVAGETTVLVTDPEKPLTAEIRGIERGGYYTFVAAYDPKTTPAASRAFLPKDYAWMHPFGMPEETTIAPMRIALSSQVQSPEVPLNGRGDDAVIVEADGHWLRASDGNGGIPIVLTGEYIHLPESVVGSEPVEELPEGAVVVGAVRLTVTEPGTYYAKDAEQFADLAVPADARGSMTWRWAVRAAEQPPAVAGFVHESSELIAEPTQTQRIALPEIETKAQPSVTPGETMSDVALVSGTLPDGGLDLSFAAYDVPFGEDGLPVWPTSRGDFSGFCTPENLVWDNRGDPERVTEPGEYRSPDVPVDTYGMTLWVEQGSIPGAEGEAPHVVVEGECGIPNETTFGMKATTLAQAESGGSSVNPGEQLWDTVKLEGALPAGGSVVVDLYQWSEDAEPVCTEETRVWSSEPVVLRGGMFREGMTIDLRERGQAFTVPDLPDGTRLGFVETTVDALGREVSKGACGEPDETVTVAVPAVASVHTLPETGGDDDGLRAVLIAAGGLLGLGTLVLVGLAIRGRRRVPAAE